LSRRRPRKTDWRSLPSAVHSANAICATSPGRIQVIAQCPPLEELEARHTTAVGCNDLAIEHEGAVPQALEGCGDLGNSTVLSGAM
jgi:hypothetical protein